MHPTLPVNPGADSVMVAGGQSLYDVCDPFPDEAGEFALMDLVGPAAVYEQLAGIIRRRIYEGTYLVGATLPAEAELAEEFRRSRPLVNRALRVLADQGLLAVRQGSGTYVASRRRFRAEVTVPRAGTAPVTEAEHRALTVLLGAAVEDEPASSGLEIRFSHSMRGQTSPPALVAAVTEETGGEGTEGVAHAAVLALATVQKALKGEMAGWDLDAATVQAGPA